MAFWLSVVSLLTSYMNINLDSYSNYTSHFVTGICLWLLVLPIGVLNDVDDDDWWLDIKDDKMSPKWRQVITATEWDERCSCIQERLGKSIAARQQTVKPRAHQQLCRNNVRLHRSNIPVCCRFWQQCKTKFRPFDKVETNWRCSICFHFESTKFSSRLLPETATMSKKHSTLSKESFDL